MKLSDALRGAADRAPLDDASVDVPRATRRASRRRGLHTGANALVGAGAVALVAVAVVGPGGSLSTATTGDDSAAMLDSRDAMEESAGADAAGGAAMDGDLASGSSIAWGLCGQSLPDLSGVDGPATLHVAFGDGMDDATVEGDVLPVTATRVAAVDGVFESYGIDGVILWDGYVVGTIDGAPGDGVARELTTLELTSGAEAVTALEVPLVDCWAGDPLPASKYQLVLSEELWAVAVAEEPPVDPVEPIDPGTDPVDPGAEPVDPGAEPDVAPVEPSVMPVDPDNSTTGTESSEDAAADDSTTSSAIGGGESGSTGMVVASAGARIVSAALDFAIAGDPVEDPFAEYLGGGPVPEPEPGATGLPDGALDPATARELYAAGLAGAWDMAAGTQRWVKTSDSADQDAYAWFGCGYGDDGRFPSQSAVMDLLDVSVAAPQAIDLSYGWIVEGNPEVRATLTNTSSWDLYNFWGYDSVQLTLVRDGMVVAEAYPVNPNQNAGIWAYAEDGGVDSLSIAPRSDVFPAGASIDGLFLWRDVNGCWTEAGQAAVEPGTYTLLASHYLSVDAGQQLWIEEGMNLTDDELAAREAEIAGATSAADSSPFEAGDDAGGWWTTGGSTDSGWGEATVGSPGSGVSTDSVDEPAIAIAPDYYTGWDAVEFQVWTSLGNVTIR